MENESKKQNNIYPSLERTPEFEEHWKQRRKIYAPMQCVYITERDDGLVRFGISHKPYERIKGIEYSYLKDMKNWDYSQPFSNAQKVLKALCQEYQQYKYRGQWFDINYQDAVIMFRKLCNKLGDANLKEIHTEPSDFEVLSFHWFKSWGLDNV